MIWRCTDRLHWKFSTVQEQESSIPVNHPESFWKSIMNFIRIDLPISWLSLASMTGFRSLARFKRKLHAFEKWWKRQKPWFGFCLFLKSYRYGNSSKSTRKCAKHLIPVPMARWSLRTVILAGKNSADSFAPLVYSLEVMKSQHGRITSAKVEVPIKYAGFDWMPLKFIFDHLQHV